MSEPQEVDRSEAPPAADPGSPEGEVGRSPPEGDVPTSTSGEERCPACGAPPSPGRWCMACGAEFRAVPKVGTLPPGGAVETRKFGCAGCGALLLFDAASGGMACRFCGSTKSIPREDGYVAVENALEEAERTAPRREHAPKTFRCDGCGAVVAFPPGVVADACPFCGSSHVVEGAGDPDRIRPAAVVPFAIPEADAKARWQAWIRKLWFRPRALRSAAGIEALRGVYVPFWTFDTQTWSRWTAMAGYRYTVTVGSGQQQRTETRTRWVPAAGERTDAYDDVLVCASKGIDERLLSRSYPYELERVQPFREEYLSGWNAEEYAVDLTDGWHRARERVNAEEIAKCGRDVPGDTHADLRVWTQHSAVTWKHLLLPLWIAAYRFRGKRWVFLVNGQTGKVSGRAPLSWAKIGLAVLVAAAVGVGVWLFLRHR